MSQKPLVTCAYGWGRTLKLYQEYLNVDGTLYALNDLMHMRAIYRRVMNISSLRLELQFHERLLLLRGIHVNDTTELVVTHLKRYCPGATITSLPLPQLQADLQRKGVAKEAKRGISMSEMPTLEHEVMPHMNDLPSTPETPRWLLELAQDMQRMQSRKMRRARSMSGTSSVSSTGTTGLLESIAEGTNKIHSIDSTNSMAAIDGMNRIDDIDIERERFAQHLQADTLPSITIPIPLRLAAGEQARYNIEATLCAEPLSDGKETPGYTYPAKDQGVLILTNRRLIYMGRRGQRVLGYARILRVSRMRGAIALLTDMTDVAHTAGIASLTNASRHVHREIFQMSRPLECALYLDHLLRQFYTQVATRHLTSEVPAMSPIQATPLNAIVKIPVTTMQEDARTTEGIDARSIQRSLPDVTDIETHPLIAVKPETWQL